MRVCVCRACVWKDGVIGFEGLRVGGLLFGGALAFHKLHGGSLDVSFGFFSLVFVWLRHWKLVRCGNRGGMTPRANLPLCILSLLLFSGGGGFYGTFLVCFFPFIFPKTKNMSLPRSMLDIILVLVCRIAVFI